MIDITKGLPPALDVANLSPFAHLVFSALDVDDEVSDVLVAKGAYALRAAPKPNGDVDMDLEPAPEASVISVVDEYHGAVNKSSVRIESDLAPFKPKCDVIVLGSAHSPDGRAVSRVVAGVRIQDAGGRQVLSHSLAIVGRRNVYKRTGLERGVASLARTLGAEASEWVLGEGEAFHEAPLRYELAFGGELKIAADDEAAARLEPAERLSDEVRAKHPDGVAAPVAHTVCRLNPVGRGFIQRWHARATGATRYAAPRIEAVDAPLTSELIRDLADGRIPCGSTPALSPQGFGVVTKAWQPRLKLAGAFDRDWQATRAPLLPKTFDMAYWNGAHPAMQCGHLQGGETVTLTNLLAAGTPGTRRKSIDATVASFRLPVTDLALRTTFLDRRTISVLLPIDTLVIDLDNMLVQITWRIRVPGGVPFLEASLLSLSELRGLVKEQARATA